MDGLIRIMGERGNNYDCKYLVYKDGIISNWDAEDCE